MIDERPYPLTIPLERAYLCGNCQAVTNNASLCACGSTALMSLARILNRNCEGALSPEQEEIQAVVRESQSVFAECGVALKKAGAIAGY